MIGCISAKRCPFNSSQGIERLIGNRKNDRCSERRGRVIQGVVARCAWELRCIGESRMVELVFVYKQLVFEQFDQKNNNLQSCRKIERDLKIIETEFYENED